MNEVKSASQDVRLAELESTADRLAARLFEVEDCVLDLVQADRRARRRALWVVAVLAAWMLVAAATVGVFVARPCTGEDVQANCTFVDGTHHVTNLESGPVFVQLSWPW